MNTIFLVSLDRGIARMRLWRGQWLSLSRDFKKRESADQAMIGSDDAMAAGPLWGRMLIFMG
jgi:hypothetical protein